MAFDGIVNKAITNEISNLCGARIDKVFEPDKNTILLGLYLNGINYLLNICIDSSNYRINLTTNSKPNPQVAPNFCMLLRKNLIGLKLKNLITLDLERLVILEFEGFDELDDIISKKLIIELMGKHGNVILIDDNNIIIDSLRHIKGDLNSCRDILPHIKYLYPKSDKFNFFDIKDFEDFLSKFDFNNLNLDNVSNIISNTFNGISKNTINSIIYELKINDLNKDTFYEIYNYLKDLILNMQINNLEFKYIKNNDGIIKDYYLSLNKTLDNKEDLNSFKLNYFIDDFYFNKETSESFKNYRNNVLKLILDILKKYNKRLANINEKLEECKDMDKYRLYGELLTTNLYKLGTDNLEEVKLENYYDDNKIITIKLNKKFNPSINAKLFFKKYSKLKNTLEIVSIQKEETLRELNYIESVIYELEKCNSTYEVADIFEEISENAIFTFKTSNYKQNKKGKIKKSKFTKNKLVSFNPIKYKIDNYEVLVGRNNKENDYLTLKFANKYDYWFHTKDIHGSHTILRLNNPSEIPSNDLLIKVAQIAAFHSKAQDSSNVKVDICKVKFVKKPSLAKPGMVIYTDYITLNVNPNNK